MRFLSLCVLLSAAVVLPPARTAHAAPQVEKTTVVKTKDEATLLYEKGASFYRKGQDAARDKPLGADPRPSLREALKIFTDLIQRFPDAERTPQASYLIGTTHFLLEEPEKALAAYERVFVKYPSSTNGIWALYRIGICQAALDQPVQARATFMKLVREFPKKKDEVKKAQRSLQELSIVGRPAPRVHASQWLYGVAEGEGVRTFRGEVVVLIFFATWCTNCEKELPHIRALMRDYSSNGAIFLGVANPRDPKNTEDVEPFVLNKELEFLDVAFDPAQASWLPYRVRSFPAAVIIDKKGIVRWRGHPAFLAQSFIEKVLRE